MPVIVNSKAQHPFLPSLGDFSAIDIERARHQDIRPLEIAIINLMADKRATERQLAEWLGNTTLQINLTFATTDDYVRGIRNGRVSYNTPSDHIKKFYNAFSDIKDLKFDGLIVTGTNALEPVVEDELIWPDVKQILEWSTTNVFSSLFLCWGAKAALKYFHDVNSVKEEQKIFGLFEHRIVSDKTGLLFGFPDSFSVPISRWKNPLKEEILQSPDLEIVAESEVVGPNVLVESKRYEKNDHPYPHRIYVLNHPEYDTETLKQEYDRDCLINPEAPLPKNYFPNNDPTQPPRNTWRHTAHLYTNWIKTVYEAVPHDLAHIPQPLGWKAAS